MPICSPKGRDCIEQNFTRKFDCKVNCEGIYADVEWMDEWMDKGTEGNEKQTSCSGENGEDMYTTIQEIVNSMKGKRGQELDKEKFKMLIAEYKAFKTKHVQHFRFDSNTSSWYFGKFYCRSV